MSGAWRYNRENQGYNQRELLGKTATSHILLHSCAGIHSYGGKRLGRFLLRCPAEKEGSKIFSKLLQPLCESPESGYIG